MFSLPTIPTDNLYKFAFIGGIVLLIFSSYLNYEAGKELSEIKQERKQIDIEFKIDSLKIVRLITIDTLQDRKSYSLKDIPKRQYKNYTVEPLDTAMVNLYKRGMTRLHTTDIKWDSFSTLKFYGAVCMFIGLVMTILGGVAWYHYVQQYQDVLLQLQLDKAQQDLALVKLDLKTKQKQYEAQYPEDERHSAT